MSERNSHDTAVSHLIVAVLAANFFFLKLASGPADEALWVVLGELIYLIFSGGFAVWRFGLFWVRLAEDYVDWKRGRT